MERNTDGKDTWKDYAAWYVDGLNKAWNAMSFTEIRRDKFIERNGRLIKEGYLAQLPKELVYIAINDNGNIGGYYRPDTVKSHLGQYVSLFVGAYGHHIFSVDEFDEFKSKKLEKLLVHGKQGIPDILDLS